MRIKRRRREGIENSAALSDLAFLLIIYFIVIAGFNINRGFLLNLPRKDSVTMVKRDELLRFTIDKAGLFYFGEQAVTVSAAEKTIRGAAAAQPNLALLLTVDGGAPWQSVVSFVELAQSLSIDSFSIKLDGVSESGELPAVSGGRDGEKP
ncbi:hypothetical protein AGMMS50230_06680 [Spirochaetia bacterium]|nr:hypothetical protein AGMMS50230_06680 [Spirochaetia bacterium]